MLFSIQRTMIADAVFARRQIARSFQGKTGSSDPRTVMSDEYHDTTKYLEFINTQASNIER